MNSFWEENRHPITGFIGKERVLKAESIPLELFLIDCSFIAQKRERLSRFLFDDVYYDRGSLQRIRSKGKVPKEFFNIRIVSPHWGYDSIKARVDLEEYKELQKDGKII